MIGAAAAETDWDLPKTELEGRLGAMLDRGAYSDLAKAFADEEIYRLAEGGELDRRFIVAAMQVIDEGRLRKRYVNLFGYDISKTKYKRRELVKALFGEMASSKIYSICHETHPHDATRWTSVLKLMLKNESIGKEDHG